MVFSTIAPKNVSRYAWWAKNASNRANQETAWTGRGSSGKASTGTTSAMSCTA